VFTIGVAVGVAVDPNLGGVVDFGFCFVQQQEDEEVLVPHTDLPENNHQPMEGSSRFLFLRFL